MNNQDDFDHGTGMSEQVEENSNNSVNRNGNNNNSDGDSDGIESTIQLLEDLQENQQNLFAQHPIIPPSLEFLDPSKKDNKKTEKIIGHDNDNYNSADGSDDSEIISLAAPGGKLSSPHDEDFANTDKVEKPVKLRFLSHNHRDTSSINDDNDMRTQLHSGGEWQEEKQEIATSAFLDDDRLSSHRHHRQQQDQQRQSRVAAEVEKGAYSAGPEGVISRNPRLPFGLVGASRGTEMTYNNHDGDEEVETTTNQPRPDILQNSSPPQQTRISHADDNDGDDLDNLVVAMPVQDEANRDLLTAQALDPESQIDKQTQQRRGKIKTVVLFVSLVLAVIIAVIIAGIYGSQNESVERVSTPTFAPSPSPSAIPSLAPTFMIDNLAEETRQAMLIADTPQSKAHAWVLRQQQAQYLKANNSYEQKRLEQLFALATFYFSLNGDAWPYEIRRSWMEEDNPNECTWLSSKDVDFQQEFAGNFVGSGNTYDKVCNNNGHYQVLALSLLNLNNKLQEVQLPAELSLLSSLEQISIEKSGIQAPLSDLIPQELATLSNLTIFSFANNDVTGTVPTIIGKLSSLQRLHLERNGISGSLPSEIGLLSDLGLLYLHHNNITFIPSEAGLLASLELFNIYDNSITYLPSELGRMTSLGKLLLYNNPIKTLPSEFGLMTSLYELKFFETLIESVPTELFSLTNLEKLYLYNNSIEQHIPTELGQLSNLKLIWMQNNRIQSALLPEIFRLTSLQSIDFSNNSMRGSVPTDLGFLHGVDPFCAARGCVDEYDSDPICSIIGCEGGGNRITLSLAHNFFHGSLPTEIGEMKFLERLTLQNNNLTGSLPTEVGKLTHLKMLNLSTNNFTGIIPSEIGLLSARISLQGNRLSGSLPVQVCWLWCGQSNIANHNHSNRAFLLEVDCWEGLDCESSCNCSQY